MADDGHAIVDGVRRGDAQPAHQNTLTTMQHREHPEAVQTCTKVLRLGRSAWIFTGHAGRPLGLSAMWLVADECELALDPLRSVR